MRELRLILVNGKKLALLYTHTGNFYSDSQHAGSNGGTGVAPAPLSLINDNF